ADANPTYKIYDPLGMQAATGTMTKDATGVYSLSYSVSGVATAGRWETVVDLTAGGSAIQDGSFWEVEGSPAQVTINSITDNTVPSITASATIKNEGSSGAEYRYEWCVVSQQTNPCGGGDDIYHASAAEFFNAGQSKTKNLNATVPNPGTYYFKLVVLWGTERSGASQQFNATTVACLGDYNSDGWVDLTDFSIQLFYWNQYNPAHDLSGDGYVNLTDFSILLFHWGKCP
ncbi:MAG: dockerin type I domain-containing protein, partial [Patescibacteria group bacterium]